MINKKGNPYKKTLCYGAVCSLRMQRKREELGLSQRGVAKRINYSNSSVQQFENYKTYGLMPTNDFFKQIAAIYQCPVEYLQAADFQEKEKILKALTKKFLLNPPKITKNEYTLAELLEMNAATPTKGSKTNLNKNYYKFVEIISKAKDSTFTEEEAFIWLDSYILIGELNNSYDNVTELMDNLQLWEKNLDSLSSLKYYSFQDSITYINPNYLDAEDFREFVHKGVGLMFEMYFNQISYGNFLTEFKSLAERTNINETMFKARLKEFRENGK